MKVSNPYADAAVRKQQALRALRLPAAIPGGMSLYTSGMQDFLSAGGPRKSMMQSIHANNLSVRELSELIGMYERDAERTRAQLTAIGVPAHLLVHLGRPTLELNILLKARARKA